MAKVVAALFILASTISADIVIYEVQYTDITSVPDDVPLNVTELKLGYNQIKTIDSFGHFTTLYKLDLRSNVLNEFPNLSTVGSSLEFLYLRSNGISEIEPSRLDNLTVLKYLDLSNNLLTSIPDVVGPSNTLRLLDISNNQLSTFPVLQNLAKAMTVFILDNNIVGEIPSQSLAYFHSVMSFSARNTGLRSFPDLRLVNDTLQSAYLSNNQILYVPKAILNEMRCLEYLELSSCGLLQMPDFSGSRSSQTIISLMLSNNQITNIPISTLSKLSAFSKLFLDGNPLKTLPNFCHVPVAFKLYMKSDDLICDCHLRWLKRAEASGVELIYPDDMICAEPSALSGITWNELTLDNLTCSDGVVRQSKPYPMSREFLCDVTEVTRWTYARSLLHCASGCLQTEGCEYFRYEAMEERETYGICGLTDASSPMTDMGMDSRPEAWYSMD